MIKKLMILIMVVIMMSCGIVVANSNGQGTITTHVIEPADLEIISYTTDVVGLENAMLRVRNQEQRQHLEQVMEKIQLKQRERFNNITDLVIEEVEGTDGAIIASGKAKVKMLGFIPMQKMIRYNINEEGEVVRQRNMFDFMFRGIPE